MEGTTLVLILLGAVVALDQVSVAQLQFAHPLVAGTVAGAIAGGGAGAGEGALIGALLGLILAGLRPVGGVIPPDGGPAAVVASAGLVKAAGLADRGAGAGGGVLASGGALAFALLIGLALGILGRGTEGWTRRRNLGFLRSAEAEATPGAVQKAVASALVLAALRGGLTVALALPVATAFVALAPNGPARGVVVALAGGVGLAAQERLLGSRRLRGLLLAGLGAILATAAATVSEGWRR